MISRCGHCRSRMRTRLIRTLTQHIMVAEGWLIKAGAALLGQEVGFGL